MYVWRQLTDMEYNRSMTWIITGANGYLGRRVVNAFQDANIPYIGFDLTKASDKNVHQLDIAHINDFFEGDHDLGNSIHGVIHLAALKNAAESNGEPEKYWVSNFDNTVKLFNFAIEKGIKKFVFASSAAVYAPKLESRIIEADSCLPSSIYGITKLAAERYIHADQNDEKIAVTSLRIFNMIGANNDDLKQEDWSNFPFRIIGNVARQMTLKAFHLKGYPSKFGVRDYVDVRDVARAFLMATQIEESLGVINISTGVEKNSIDLIVEFERELQRKLSFEVSEPLFDEVAVCVGDSTKAQKSLKWNPSFNTSETVRQIIFDCELK